MRISGFSHSWGDISGFSHFLGKGAGPIRGGISQRSTEKGYYKHGHYLKQPYFTILIHLD